MAPPHIRPAPRWPGSATAAAASCRSVPLRDDVDGDCEWLAPVPGTDVAIMLALAHVLATESLADRAFLATYCTGYDTVRALSARHRRRHAEIPEWAAAICGLPADTLRTLARRMAAGRTIVTVSWSLQRVRHGEQAPWMGLTLAAMLGQIGLPGGGFGHGYGSMNEPGLPPLRCRLPVFPQGPNPVATFIPVAAVSDMLLHPGESFDFNGQRLTFPDIRCVYWAGGNPFHHHQNLPRLRRALARVDTVVVHDPYWTAMAKHADIVVPSTTAYERDDFSGSRNDPLLMAMPALAEPYAQSRNDYQTFAALADRLGFGEAFTEGRTEREWLEHIYDKWAAELDFACRRSTEFWAAGSLRLPVEDGLTLLADFRADPHAHRLATPSGRIEIYSSTIDGFGYADCAGHPRWYEPDEWLGGAARAALPAAPAGQPARHPAAQPARRRRHQPGIESARARTDPDASRRCGRARTGRRRRRAGVQRPRGMPGRAGHRRPPAPRCRAAVHRRVVRPGRTRPTRMRCACTAIRTC